MPTRLALAVLTLVALAAGAWAAPPVSAPPPEPPAGPAAAYERALALQREMRFTESLRWYHAALPYAPPDLAAIHRSYAGALYGSTFETRPDGRPFSRSSVERVAAMRSAIAALERLRDYPLQAEQRSEMLGAGAQMLRYWGFPWEAEMLFRAASAADPRDRGALVRHRAMVTLMRDPERYSLDAIPVELP